MLSLVGSRVLTVQSADSFLQITSSSSARLQIHTGSASVRRRRYRDTSVPSVSVRIRGKTAAHNRYSIPLMQAALSPASAGGARVCSDAEPMSACLESGGRHAV